ncbi:sensor histidine kinase [Microlunatus sp. GCM10028923]|uniref:sensor histidine kinase n=1 Tax=Microlunatus sp. GCM10028923 TaxID=3273400 RepID=UPI00360A6676
MSLLIIVPVLAAAVIAYLAALRLPRLRWVPTRVIGALSALGLLLSAAGGGPVLPWPVLPWPGPAVQAVGSVILALSIIGAGWTIGRAVRDRRAYVAKAAEQAAARAVTEERLRIARELHDIVAHNLSLITVKAGVAAHVAETRPDEVVDALRVIERSGRGALDEIRHLLELLRTGAADSDLAPAPTLDRLPELGEAATAAGVQVAFRTRGLDDVPEDVGRAAYRIVQEAVTNVVRHAAPARCTVRVIGEQGELLIEVSDDGPGVRGARPPGHGLIGMRERIALHHGTFHAGPGDHGGFMITARLPYTARLVAA